MTSEELRTLHEAVRAARETFRQALTLVGRPFDIALEAYHQADLLEGELMGMGMCPSYFGIEQVPQEPGVPASEP